MPNWGWFVIALVIVDLVAVVTWFALRQRHSRRPQSGSCQRPVDAETLAAVTVLVHERKPAQAMAVLQTRTTMSLRQAKNVVDALDIADREHSLERRTA
ncbi:MAG: hypothetical protein WBF79_07065 [Rhodococcus sp. (in: high G+C Gram-positive bacteria)]